MSNSKTAPKQSSRDAAPEKASMRPPDDVKALLASAEKVIADVDQAHVMKSHQARRYPTFDHSELSLGAVLGVGGFAVVSEVSAIHVAQQHDELVEEHPDDHEDPLREDNHYDVDSAKQKMSKRCIRYGTQARYAIKLLDPKLSDLDRTRGMIDMSLEVKYLKVLWHPNLVKMRGISSDNMMTPKFFFVMDRLYDTLDVQLQKWSKIKKTNKGGLFGIGKDKEAKKHLLVERLVVAYDLAAAFAYMHGNMLVYRDIKQENIAFDVRGDVKVFDFGLTKALLPTLKVKKGKGYNLTPITGSLPYMAPEVAMKLPYDSRCDVFSFAFLFHEIMSLKDTPYHAYIPREYFQRVVKGSERPSINRSWPKETKEVMKLCWDHDQEKRLDMRRIAQMIRADLNEISEEDEIANRTRHMKDRSTRSIDNDTPSENMQVGKSPPPVQTYVTSTSVHNQNIFESV